MGADIQLDAVQREPLGDVGRALANVAVTLLVKLRGEGPMAGNATRRSFCFQRFGKILDDAV